MNFSFRSDAVGNFPNPSIWVLLGDDSQLSLRFLDSEAFYRVEF